MSGTSEGRRGPRAALLVLGAVALLALGVAFGTLYGKGQSSGLDRPAADSVAVGFSQDMVAHHLQAVEMSAVAYTNSDDPLVRGLAFDILTGQQNQIGYMEGWLLLWDRPVRPTSEHMAWMGGDGDPSGHGGHGAGTAEPGAAPARTDGLMPGMATREELAALRTAGGTELDVLFLQLMLRHHQGGLPMLAYAAERAEVPAVRQTAAKMLDLQDRESDLLTDMLRERGAEPLPMN